MLRVFLLLLFIGLPLGALALAWLAVSDRPEVAERVELNHRDVARAKRILRDNDPRQLRPSSRRQVSIDQQDVQLAVHYLAQTLGQIHTRVRLSDGRALLTATRRIPWLPQPAYLNLSLELREHGDLLELGRIRLGRIDVPPWLVNPFLGLAVELATSERQAKLLRAAVQDVELNPGEVRLSYIWNPALLEELTALVDAKQRAALRAFQTELAELSRDRPRRLNAVLNPLFELAGQRSRHGNPIAENRALLSVLGAWAVGQHLPLPGDRPQAFAARLRGRIDLAQHYLVSAALAAAGDTRLANAVGLQKEIADVGGRSGFSFSDIAADLAGSRLGQLATASPASAREIQVRLANLSDEDDYMPAVADLPDHLSEREFRRRFERVDSPAYRSLLQDIERRIDARPLYRRPTADPANSAADR